LFSLRPFNTDLPLAIDSGVVGADQCGWLGLSHIMESLV
jgi:hypothetical protein